jgi:S1-C subfamily serine protease
MQQRLGFVFALVGLIACAGFLHAQERPSRPKASLGVMVGPMAPPGEQGGVAVLQVAPDSPAAKAGMKPGDVIVKAGDKSIKDFDDLLNTLAQHKAGDKLPLEVRRDGKEQKLTVTLGQRPAGQNPPREGQPPQRTAAFLGVQSQPVTPELKSRLNLGADQGVLVTEVVPNSPAAKAGLKTEDVITAVNGKAVNDPRQLREAVRQAGVGKEVTLKVVRGQKTQELKAKLEEAPGGISFPSFPPGFRPPEGFPNPGGQPPFVSGDAQKKIQQLEKQVQDLEKRVRELEKKQSGK